MNDRQRRFVSEYIVDLNGTQAAIRAGYSAKTANEQAARLLADVSIAREITAAIAKRTERVEVTQDYVIGKLLENVQRAMQAEPVLDKLGNPTGEYVYQGAVANQALNLLGKHLGMFADQVHTRDLTFEDVLRQIPAEGDDAEAARQAERLAKQKPDISRVA